MGFATSVHPPKLKGVKLPDHSDIYRGRLVADGNGNLLADEGPREGEPVAYHDGSYIFIKPGELSHNERHHENFAGVVLTQTEDPDAPGYAGDEDDPTEGNEHHFAVQEDDPHYNGVRNDPDKVAARITGHTDAYTGGDE
jgi:hypothetical protein